MGYVVAYVVKIATPRNATRPTNSNNSENFGLNDALFRCPKAPIQNLEHSKCRKMLRKVYNKCFKKKLKYTLKGWKGSKGELKMMWYSPKFSEFFDDVGFRPYPGLPKFTT